MKRFLSAIKSTIKYVVLFAIFFGSIYAISTIPPSSSSGNSNSEETTQQAPLKRVKVLELIPQPFEETILLPGTVEASADVTVGAGIPGIVEAVHIEEGDRVKKGQRLIQIDLRAREARLTEAKAAHELAKKTLERMQKLRKRGDVTVQEYDEAVAAESQRAASVRSMDVDVSLGHIIAPMNGIVDRIDVEQGEYVHDGTPLARLLAMDTVEIKGGVPERYADAVSREKEAVVIMGALGEERVGKMERLAFGANTLTNTFEATVVLDNPDHRIRPGMIVQVQLTTKRVSDALLVPLFALVKREDGMVVFVEKDGKVQSRRIVLGSFQKDQIEVIDGLQPHERIIVIGQQDLVEDQLVQVAEVDSLLNEPLTEGEIR